MALDFISLVLSKKSPSTGAATLSPFLQQHVPSGCLGAELVQKPPLSESDGQDQDLVTLGWRMRSLSTAADSLLASVTRLQKEISKETAYWDGLMAVKEQGWSIYRHPRERHTLAVRYGFAGGG